MFCGTRYLPCRNKFRANKLVENQSYNVDSPNEMVMDTDDYVGVANISEKESVAIINPDGIEQGDSDQQLQDLPLANDCMSCPIGRASLFSGANKEGKKERKKWGERTRHLS